MDLAIKIFRFANSIDLKLPIYTTKGFKSTQEIIKEL